MTANPWAYIQNMLGPGMQWGRSDSEFHAFIEQALQDGQPEVAEHLMLMLERRNAVMMEKPTSAIPGHAQSQQ